MAKKGMNPDWLKGLFYTGAEREEIEKDGRKTFQFLPFKRPLTESEVLDWKDKGESVVIVTADGRKYTVKKGATKNL